ncbi:MAG: HAD family hydrolase [Lachnospiraceae bacterium]
MIKLVASDLDGTLLRNNAQSLGPEVFDLILKLKEKGIYFVAASGRQLASMYQLFAPIKDEISYIAENGTLCIHDKQVVSRTVFERDLALEIIDTIRSLGDCEILMSCEDKCYIESKDEVFKNHIYNVIKNDTEQVEDLKLVNQPCLKLAVCNYQEIEKLSERFKKQYGNQVTIAVSGNIWLDFIPPHVNKGICLEKLIQKLGVKQEECMVFGDQYNDIEMLQFVDLSYAMSTAAPGVAYYSTYVTDSVEDVLIDLIAQV